MSRKKVIEAKLLNKYRHPAYLTVLFTIEEFKIVMT